MSFEQILLIIVFLGMPIIWDYLFKSSGFKYLNLTIPSIIYLSSLIFNYIGYPIIYLKINLNRNLALIDNELLIETWFYTSLSTTFFLLGTYFCRRYFGTIVFNKYNLDFQKITKSQKFRIFGVIALCIFVLFSFIHLLGGIFNTPIGKIFSSTSYEMEYARSTITSNLSGLKYHRFKTVFNVFFLYSYLALFCNYIKSKKTIINNIIIFSILPFLLISIFIFYTKLSFALLIFSIFIIYIFTIKEGNIKASNLIYFFFISLFFLMLIVFLFSGDLNGDMQILSKLFLERSKNILIQVFSRVCLGPIQAAYYYIEYFRLNPRLYMGDTFPNPGGILPFSPLDITEKVQRYVHGTGVYAMDYLPGDTNPAIYWCEMLLNFGPLGVIFSSFLLGAYTFMINRILFSLKNSPITIGLFAYLCGHFITVNLTGLSSFIIDVYLILSILLFLFFNWNNGRLFDIEQ